LTEDDFLVFDPRKMNFLSIITSEDNKMNCFSHTIIPTRQTILSLLTCALAAAALPQDIKTLTIKPANSALIGEVHSYVIIDKTTHEDLWNCPLFTTMPGEPNRLYLSINIADRRGKDLSFGARYYTSTDFFQTKQELDSLPPGLFPPWSENIEVKIKGFPEKIFHLTTSPPVFIDRDHAIKAFTHQLQPGRYSVSSALCTFADGKLIVQKMGNSHTIENSARGLYEPHAVRWHEKFYMTCRAEDGYGYLLVSDDGLNWSVPEAWRWDNGEKIAMDQTMTKLLVHSQGLALCYTRILPDNAETFRHRAPLHLADVDVQTLRLKKDTECIIVPNKGLPVGNFWVWPVNQQETCVATAEWPRDEKRALQKINGDIWFCRIKWRRPNTLMTADGRDSAATAVPRISEAGLVLSFDDCNLPSWREQMPLFKKYNARVTFFIDHFDKLDKSQIEVLEELRQAGHAIGCHGWRHEKAVEYYQAHGMEKYLQDEIEPAVQAMKQHGFMPTCFAYPNSCNDDKTDAALLKTFRHLRSGSHSPGKRLADKDDIFIKVENIAKTGVFYGGSCQSHNADDDVSAQTIAALQRAKANDEILFLYAHDIRNPGTKGPKNYIAIKSLEKILSYARQIGLRFYNFDDLL